MPRERNRPPNGYQRELAPLPMLSACGCPRLEQPTVPERLLQHLATIESMAKTASHTMEFVKKTLYCVLLSALIFSVVRIGNAGSDNYSASAEKDREIAAAVKVISDKMDLLHGDNAENRKTVIQFIEQLERISK